MPVTPLRRAAPWMAALATAALVLGPAIAEARPGGSSSSGSRGSRTYSAPPATNTAPSSARPMERTNTAPSTPATAAPGVAGRPAAAPAAATGNRFGTGLMAGLAGGLLGAGLFGLLSGSGLFGGLAGFAGFLGLLLQLALIGGVIWLVMRLIRGNRAQPALAGGPGRFARDAQPMPAQPMAGGGGGGPATQPVQLAAADFQAFERLLGTVNQAWSARDQRTLEAIATREMAAYFAQDRRDLDARGWDNQTRDVKLEQGDLSEAWREGSVDYATVALRFSLVDWTRDRAGTVVEGDPNVRQTVTELWTFRREFGDDWKLSAIQQTT
jgi:predicted lipid-binding transport protein (Tim44 family)